MRNIVTRLLVMLVIIAGAATLQAQDSWTPKKANKWLKKGSWRNGCQLQPHESINTSAFAEQYHKNQKIWDSVFRFLATHDLSTIANGTYNIDSTRAYVSVSEYTGKTFEESKWEAHKNYIDIQIVAASTEKIGIMPLSEAQETTPYKESKDVAFYTSDKGTYYVAVPGMFFLFFPSDAHRPGIKLEATTKVKKVVVKIKVVA